MIILRKFLGFILTTSLTAVLLTIYFAITEGSSLLLIGLIFTGAFPFVLLIGVPVSFLSDYLTKNLNGKIRTIVALFIHTIFGLIAGLVIVISNLLEGIIIVVATIIAALIFWLVDEILRKNSLTYSSKLKILEKEDNDMLNSFTNKHFMWWCTVFMFLFS